MWCDNESDDDELPPIPWLHDYRFAVAGPLPVGDVKEVQFPISGDRSAVLPCEGGTAAAALRLAEIYLSQFVTDSYVGRVLETTVRCKHRFEYLPPNTTVDAALQGSRLVLSILPAAARPS